MYVSHGVGEWGAWVNIEGYDPSPGQRGWYRSIRGPLGEDCRLIAEFEWETRQNWVGLPVTLQELLDHHFRNSSEQNRS